MAKVLLVLDQFHFTSIVAVVWKNFVFCTFWYMHGCVHQQKAIKSGRRNQHFVTRKAFHKKIINFSSFLIPRRLQIQQKIQKQSINLAQNCRWHLVFLSLFNLTFKQNIWCGRATHTWRYPENVWQNPIFGNCLMFIVCSSSVNQLKFD